MNLLISDLLQSFRRDFHNVSNLAQSYQNVHNQNERIQYGLKIYLTMLHNLCYTYIYLFIYIVFYYVIIVVFI